MCVFIYNEGFPRIESFEIQRSIVGILGNVFEMVDFFMLKSVKCTLRMKMGLTVSISKMGD